MYHLVEFILDKALCVLEDDDVISHERNVGTYTYIKIITMQIISQRSF